LVLSAKAPNLALQKVLPQPLSFAASGGTRFVRLSDMHHIADDVKIHRWSETGKRWLLGQYVDEC
jgi:hypothetical protein